MTNHKYNPSNSSKPLLIDLADDDPEWIREFHIVQKFSHPHKCDLITCGITFENHNGHGNTLPGKRLYCSSLCAYRDKKRTMAKSGIVVR